MARVVNWVCGGLGRVAAVLVGRVAEKHSLKLCGLFLVVAGLLYDPDPQVIRAEITGAPCQGLTAFYCDEGGDPCYWAGADGVYHEMGTASGCTKEQALAYYETFGDFMNGSEWELFEGLTADVAALEAAGVLDAATVSGCTCPWLGGPGCDCGTNCAWAVILGGDPLGVAAGCDCSVKDWDGIAGCTTQVCGGCVGTFAGGVWTPLASACTCGACVSPGVGWADGTVLKVGCQHPCGGPAGDQDGDGCCAVEDVDDNDPAVCAQPAGCPSGYTMGPCGCGTSDADGDGCCPQGSIWQWVSGQWQQVPNGNVDCNDNNYEVCVTCGDGDPCETNIYGPGCACEGLTETECTCLLQPENQVCDGDPCDAQGGDADQDGCCDDIDADPADPGSLCGDDPEPCERLGGDVDGDGCCGNEDEDDNDDTVGCGNCEGKGGDEDEDGCCADDDPDDDDATVDCDCNCDLTRGPLGEWLTDLEHALAPWELFGDAAECQPFDIEFEVPYLGRNVLVSIPCNFIPGDLPGDLTDKLDAFRQIVRGFFLLVLSWRTFVEIIKVLLSW